MKMIFDLDIDKCVACGACAVACMDQNDIDPSAGDPMYRVVQTVESYLNCGERSYLSLSCMHCDNAPCISACPVQCISKNEMGLTVYDNTKCIGCHSCAMACPYGAPKYTVFDKMVKCHGCYVRQQYGYQPACVRICPTGALICKPEEEYISAAPQHSLRNDNK